ncbi:LuxR family transcriptional regulator [Erythrobacter sp. THAF29]|uniref:helix-turn-helix transcriptional regulator n=1 Tax=Erythrobacter sp. THAF29 TaxID=2587851 RepID=UPI001561D64B|nr:LuxR family transcriptional regulator [Erythrobacter sp. THAF29]
MASELETILRDARDFAQSRGATSGSYRLVPSFHSQLDPDALLYHFGFPEAWVRLYDEDPDFRRHDPIADYVIQAGRPMTWQEALSARALTPEQQEFAEAMTEHGLIHGMAAPIYGPHGREAYVTFSWDRPPAEGDEELIEELTAYATKLHRQIVLMIEPAVGERPAFSRREREVLIWIARGKSNSDIATILGVSDATVSTYVSRIFRKLGVHNRMAATLMGLKHGLVRL